MLILHERSGPRSVSDLILFVFSLELWRQVPLMPFSRIFRFLAINLGGFVRLAWRLCAVRPRAARCCSAVHRWVGCNNKTTRGCIFHECAWKRARNELNSLNACVVTQDCVQCTYEAMLRTQNKKMSLLLRLLLLLMMLMLKQQWPGRWHRQQQLWLQRLWRPKNILGRWWVGLLRIQNTKH